MKNDGLIIWAQRILYFGFIILPITAGIDKYIHFFTEWEKYLSPAFQSLLPVKPHIYMKIVGAIEIFAGLLVAFAPRVGGAVVSIWLLGIVVNLSLMPNFYDIALRDIGLSLAALTLSLLSSGCKPVSDRTCCT
jgi:hypothetical protein